MKKIGYYKGLQVYQDQKTNTISWNGREIVINDDNLVVCYSEDLTEIDIQNIIQMLPQRKIVEFFEK